ncbi:MAG TPA: hypothetical protein DCE23_04040 [Firmicutes bacterium]|nr:hypothetical protein [Bacillota bacterium]
MTRSEFVEATSRLEQYYGKEYTTQQLQIMFEELNTLAIERYRRLISAVIRKSKYLPKVADIMEANIEEPYTNENNEKQVIECKKCNSTGYVLYTKVIKNGGKDLKYTYVAICSCGNAKQYDGTKIMDKEHRSKYYTPLAVELGI